MKVAIMTDSNSGIMPEDAKDLGLYVIPMPVIVNGEEYYENENITQEQFYEKLKQNADVLTSQPSIFGIAEKWEEMLKEYDQIVYIPMSSGLSGSCQTATVKAEEFNGKVFVVDNKRISVTQKQAVFDALELAKEGKSGEEIKEYLLDTSMKSSIYIMLDTLKYLKRGGRLTPAAALLGSLLRIKPVLTIQGEKLDKFCQVMVQNMGKKKMIEQIEHEINTRFKDELENGKLVVNLAYTNNIEKCEQFKIEVNEMLSKYNLEVTYVDALPLSISCHIGDGALGIAICSKN